MFTTLLTETGPSGGFPVQGLITVLVLVAVFYPIQKKVRAVASRRRREHWVQEGLLTEADQQDGAPGEDEDDPDGRDDRPA